MLTYAVDIIYTGDALWQRIERAVEKVKDRMRRVTTALDAAKIPYAIVGGNAVQLCGVAQVDYLPLPFEILATSTSCCGVRTCR